jgi:hypothetical protein
LIYRQLVPARKSVAALLSGFGTSSSDFDIRVENRKTGAGVRVTGDRPLSRLYYWSIPTVLSRSRTSTCRSNPAPSSSGISTTISTLCHDDSAALIG